MNALSFSTTTRVDAEDNLLDLLASASPVAEITAFHPARSTIKVKQQLAGEPLVFPATYYIYTSM